jgi:glycosyltransferase involved in cell wall biosynthesis
MNGIKKAVVIPCFKVADSIRDVVCSIPATIDHIIVVDDKCPQGSGRIAEEIGDKRVIVIYHKQNQGVGAAVISGYKKALELGCDIFIKVDGDGQMDLKYIEPLIAPLIRDEADYTKGNRFMDFKALKCMPKARLVGNNVLSFLAKAFSGYWDIMDPTNGYTAIHKRVLQNLDLRKIANGYFFESDMLLNLNLINAVVKDVAMPAKYGDENSSLTIRKALLKFPSRLLYGFMKRILLKYFIYDFNMASVYILIGVPMFIWGVVFGAVEWIDSYVNNVLKTTGTIMLSVLPLIISFEMLLQAVGIDISLVPKRKK